MQAITLSEFISMAGVCVAVERGDPHIVKLEIVEYAPQPRMFDGLSGMSWWDFLADTLDLDSRLVESVFKLTDSGKIRDHNTVGCHSAQRQGQLRMRHPIQAIYTCDAGEVSKPVNQSTDTRFRMLEPFWVKRQRTRSAYYLPRRSELPRIRAFIRPNHDPLATMRNCTVPSHSATVDGVGSEIHWSKSKSALRAAGSSFRARSLTNSKA